MILCNPHNPIDRIWDCETLERIGELCWKHHVTVVSDEIHSDFTREGHPHTVFAKLGAEFEQNCLICTAPSKTFNLAGLIGSYHIIYSKWLRDRVDKESSLCHYNEINVLSMHALIGAYKPEGYEWVDELNQVLANNVDFACEHIWEQYKGIQVTKPQGTYMHFPRLHQMV